jgi:hypothetical protein
MKLILNWCINHGVLPRRPWFFNLVARTLVYRRDIRDDIWWVELDGNVSPEAARNFQIWWYDLSKPPETAQDDRS